MLKRLLIAASVALLIPGCRSTHSAPIILGAAGPWTEEYGAMNRRGIELAVDELNAREAAPHVEVVFRDDGGDGCGAGQACRRVVCVSRRRCDHRVEPVRRSQRDDVACVLVQMTVTVPVAVT